MRSAFIYASFCSFPLSLLSAKKMACGRFSHTVRIRYPHRMQTHKTQPYSANTSHIILPPTSNKPLKALLPVPLFLLSLPSQRRMRFNPFRSNDRLGIVWQRRLHTYVCWRRMYGMRVMREVFLAEQEREAAERDNRNFKIIGIICLIIMLFIIALSSYFSL